MRRFGTKNLNEQKIIPNEPTPIGKTPGSKVEVIENGNLKLRLYQPGGVDDPNKLFLNVQIPIDSIRDDYSGITFDVIDSKYRENKPKLSGYYKCYGNTIQLTDKNSLQGKKFEITDKAVNLLTQYTTCKDYVNRGNTDTPDMA
jgi:hypothetical protein